MSYRTEDAPLLTVREYLAYPEHEAHHVVELSRGRLVREGYVAALHGLISTRVAYALEEYARRAGGTVLSTAGFVLSELPATVRAPDVAWIAGSEPVPAEGLWSGAPDLAVEVNSPSNSASHIHEKVTQLLDAGTRIVWVIDPPSRTVTVYRSREDIRIVGEAATLDGADVAPGLRIPVVSLLP